MCDLSDIKRYIVFLKQEMGLFISLHPIKDESLILPSELITFNIHDNSYCTYVKSFPEAQKHCIERQKKIISRMDCGSICGSCFAGVREYVYPIENGTGVVGFISVSGYQSENAESFISETSRKYTIPRDSLRRAYDNLDPMMPPKERIDTLITPLCRMLELAYLKNEDTAQAREQLIDRVIRYVKTYHTRNITIDDVCQRFFCSRSHISHSFKKHTGKSFREYLTDLRIDDARSLLRYSGLSVTEIASSVGFGDSNYFSNLFKKKTGYSPLSYRKTFK